MQQERLSRSQPQDVHMVKLVPEQAIPAMEHATQQSIIAMLQTLPVPITITRKIRERDGKSYYTYQIGEKTEEHPYGLGMGATPSFLAAVRFSLQRAMQQKSGGG